MSARTTRVARRSWRCRRPAGRADIAALEDLARRIRVAVIRTVMHVRVGHVGGPLSAADILAALYWRVLRIRPDGARLAGAGPLHPLQGPLLPGPVRGHGPVRLLPGRRAGHLRPEGLAPARSSRHAQAARHRHVDRLAGHGPVRRPWLRSGRSPPRARDVRTYVLLGDGECQEGQVWEAAHVAARYRRGQSHRHRRPQQAAAVRLARRRRQAQAAAAGSGRPGGTFRGLRLAGPRDRRTRHGRSRGRRSRRRVDPRAAQPSSSPIP